MQWLWKYCSNIFQHHSPPLPFPTTSRRQSLPGNRYILLPPVSTEANNLINALLSARESRLSARKYRDNDVQQRQTSHRTGNNASGNADFVFENDAKDIKRHSFFRGVDWENIHQQIPPFIPHIDGDQSITKYFEDEKDILGSEGEQSATSVDYSECYLGLLNDMPERVAAALPRLFGCHGASSAAAASASAAAMAGAWDADEGNGGREDDGNALVALKWLAEHDSRTLKALWKRQEQRHLHHHGQQHHHPGHAGQQAGQQQHPPPPPPPPYSRKRARDKILRDPRMYRTAMHVRKRYAFMGYTYRRPHYVKRGSAAAVVLLPGRAGDAVSGVDARPVIGEWA